MLPTLRRIAVATIEHLARTGTPGSFLVDEQATLYIVSWNGSRHHRGIAERAMVEALAGAGIVSERLQDIGVRVRKVAQAQVEEPALAAAA